MPPVSSSKIERVVVDTIWVNEHLVRSSSVFANQSNQNMDAPPSTGQSNGCLKFQYFYSTVLLCFCIFLILSSVFTDQTSLAQDVNAFVAFLVLIVAILWLTMVEGGQGAIVGLKPVQHDLYKESHPTTYKITTAAHEGDNLDRYLLGRQFMVILIVFTVNMAAEPIEGAQLWDLPDWLINLFLGSGIAMILFTNMVGQLNSEVNSCHHMLDYLNTNFAVFTFWVARAIEFTGLLHTGYVVQMIVGHLAGQPVESKEPPRDLAKNLFFWGRCAMSVAALGYALAVTLKALLNGQTKMWEGVPPAVSVLIFFLLMGVVGILESMQIAYFAVSKLTKAEREQTHFGKSTCRLLFDNNGHGVEAFLLGRQLSVVTCMFVIARVTGMDLEDGEENVFGVSDGLQSFFNTGLLGALCVALIASIPWRLFGSAFPMFFVNNPLVYVFLRVCLWLEMTGICFGAYVIAAVHKRVAGFQRDEVYIGTAEERAAKGLADDEEDAASTGSHMYPPTARMPNTVEDLEGVEEEIKSNIQKLEDRLRLVQEEKTTLRSVGSYEA